MHLSLRSARPVPIKVVRAFKRAINLELNGNRERDWKKYRDVLLQIAAGLGLQSTECSPLYLDNATAEWIKRFPELA